MHRNERYNPLDIKNPYSKTKQLQLLAYGVLFISLSTLIVIIYQIFYNDNVRFDAWIFNMIAGYTTSATTNIILFFTLLGSHKFLIPAWILLSLYYYLVLEQKQLASRIFGVGLINLIMMFLLKNAFNRARPLLPVISNVPGLSFPSGHAFMGLTFFSIIIYLVLIGRSNVIIKYSFICVLVFTIFMIGFSRIYLRLHYATDVLAGFCFGMITMLLFYKLQNKLAVNTK